MAFDQRFLEELNARCDIVDIVSRYVQLKKSGGNYFGLCPFHNEKTASFSVAPDKQIYHCFGCGAGGGPISFIMKAEGLGFKDAVQFLAKQYNMTVPDDHTDPAQRHRRERVLSLMTDAARFFYQQLYIPEHQAALQYFKSRALSRRTMNQFGLGYAPDSFHALIDAMLAKGYTKEELLSGGLVARSDKNGRFYDKFRGRVMFPIIDVRGNVIAFGGRVLDDSLPKYLNSPETIVFSKSRNLFALNIARKSKFDFILLAEGYMDVIALHQAGFQNAVASLGTSLTEEQARLISQTANTAVICYDSDEAGQKASQRAIDILKRAGLSVRVLRIPGAKDPDQFIKENGVDAFRRLLEKSANHIEYRLEALLSQYDIKEDEQRVSFLREAAKLLAGLDSPAEREIYAARVAQIVKISPEAMGLEVKKAFKSRQYAMKKAEKRAIRSPVKAVQPRDRQIYYEDIRSARAEEGILSLIFTDNTVLDFVSQKIKPQDFTAPVLRKIYELAQSLYQEGQLVSIAAFEGLLQENELAHLAGILSRPVALSSAEKAIEDFINTIYLEKAKRGETPEENGEDPMLAFARTHRENQGFGGTKE